jgi:hypothetical protein
MFSSIFSYAGELNFNGYVKGSGITGGATINLEDPEYYFMKNNPSWGNTFSNYKLENYVVLRYTGSEGDNSFYTSGAWSVTVNYELQVWNYSTGAMTSYPNQSLTIDYDPATTFQDVKINAIAVPGHKIKVIVNSLSNPLYPGVVITPSSLNSGVLTNDFSLEAQVRVERYHKLNQTVALNTIVHKIASPSSATNPATIDPAQTSEVEFAWPVQQGAEEYDFEWVYYFDSPAGGPDFSKASRIVTAYNHYKLSTVYEQGYIFYRVRPVGLKGTSFDHRAEGAWSNGTHTFQLTASHDIVRNWTYGAAFAENGKVVETVNYFDGALKKRQSVVKSFEDNTAIVSETMYDYEGRPVVNTLPAPSGVSSSLKFFDQYSLNYNSTTLSTSPFSKEHFDKAANYNSPAMLDRGDGGSYYSDLNPLRTEGFNSYIPDAGGYPYVRELYGADGRIRKASGPGYDHRIGSGHETEFFVGTPLQKKLDMLFGTEAGISKYYRQYITKDANGQYNVTYENMRGQTVATALAGEGPSSVEQLSTNATRLITADFNASNDFIPSEEAWVNHVQIFVPVAGRYKFNYTLTSEQYNSLCSAQDHSCVYDLNITLYDECNQKLEDDLLYNNNNNDILHSPRTWVFTVAAPQSTGDFYVDFTAPGSYTLEKRLTLNQQALQSAVDLFTAQVTYGSGLYSSSQTCVPDYTTLLSGLNGSVDLSECQACTTGCIPASGGCDVLYQRMIKDMSPGGQYFENLSAINSTENNIWLNSFVWNECADENRPCTPSSAWTNANFLDADGNLIDSWDELENNWDPAFADQQFLSSNYDPFGNGPHDSLVEFHPEYCHWVWCKQSEGSNDFDNTLYGNSTYSWAQGQNFITSGVADETNILTADPFFSGGLPSLTSYYNTMYNKMTAGYTAGSMWDNAVDVVTSSGCTVNCSDLEWQVFVSTYVYEKRLLMEQYKTTTFNCKYLYDETPKDFVVDCPRPDGITFLDNKTCEFHLHNVPLDPVPPIDQDEPFANNIHLYNSTSFCDKIASAQFTVSGAAANVTASVTVNGINTSGNVALTSGWSAIQVATAITNAINNNTPTTTPNYYAYNNAGTSATVTVYAEPFTGTGPNGYDLGFTNLTVSPSGLIEMAGGVDNTCAPENVAKNCFCEEIELIVQEGYTQNLISSSSAEDAYVAAVYNTAYSSYNLSVTAQQVNNWRANCTQSLSSDQGQHPEEWDAVNEEYVTPYTVPQVLRCYEEPNTCEQDALAISGYYAAYFNQQNITQAVADFKERYKAHCLGRAVAPSTTSTNGVFNENFTVEFTDREYHYTLYYYDLAGNLTRTIPPNVTDRMFELGVMDQAFLDLYRNHHDNGSTPDHQQSSYYSTTLDKFKRCLNTTANTQIPPVLNTQFVTNYKHNTNDKVIEQKSPDAGETKFWYDDIGRVVASQNLKQLGITPNSAYSYTRYDEQGRIVEVGELTASNAPTSTTFNASNYPYNWAITRKDVTQTYYDDALTGIPAQFSTGTQDNLRSHISTITYSAIPSSSSYDHATHYSYDMHGNVKELLQENPILGASFAGQQFKRVQYEFDVLTGNVMKVIYQKNQDDQFIHKYWYDGNNRLLAVFTSGDGVIWDRDAEYFYYRHGPVARVELGDKKVQGLDYAYTISGVIKGVNSNTLNTLRDIGKDGVNDDGTGSYIPLKEDIHRFVGKDAAGYTLRYFTNDYKAVNDANLTALTRFEADMSLNTSLNTNGPSLYNGNISRMVTAITDPTTGTVIPQLTAYYYDQLNRLISMKAYRDIDFTNNRWNNGSTYNSSYETRMRYDHSGNILGLFRNGLSPVLSKDSLSYKYLAGTNQLSYVRDRVNGSTAHSGNYTEDIDDQATGNYGYDAIGNLTKDAQEYIDDAVTAGSSIEWNAYGKITKVTRTTQSHNKPDLEFAYDAMGLRIMKLEKPRVNGVQQVLNTWTYTYYVRDAEGNVLSTYTKPPQKNALNLGEQFIYGGARLGSVEKNVDLAAISAPASPYGRTVGQKLYEIGNHLSNVITVIGDRRITGDNFNYVTASGGNYTFSSVFNDYLYTPGTGTHNRVTGSDGVADENSPIVLSATDYGAWGDALESRSFYSNKYKYGFNGMEKDNEMFSASGTSYSAEFWQYDSRLARRWNIDPKPNPSISSYSAFALNPIAFNDLAGDTPTVAEAAVMADHVYTLKDGVTGTPQYTPGGTPVTLVGGWEITDQFSDLSSGFKGAFYQRSLDNGTYEYAFVTAGTEDLGKDGKTDAIMYMVPTNQYKISMYYATQATKYARHHPGTQVTFIGHSLGGALATVNAKHLNFPAITFNAAGVGLGMNLFYDIPYKPKIDAWIVEGEILNKTLGLLGQGAEGTIHTLPASYKWDGTYWYQSGMNHTMGVVIQKLKEQWLWTYKGSINHNPYDLIRKSKEKAPSPTPWKNAYQCTENACFGAGTLVLIENHELLQVSKLKQGDLVLTYDDQSSSYDTAIVKEVVINNVSNCYKLVLETGEDILITSNHIVKTLRGDMTVSDLKIGDSIITWNNSTIRVINKELAPVSVVYNILITDNAYLILLKAGIIVEAGKFIDNGKDASQKLKK